MPTRLIPEALARDLTATLARLRIARTVNPSHKLPPGQTHSGCEICTCEHRLNWLLDQLPRDTGREQ